MMKLRMQSHQSELDNISNRRGRRGTQRLVEYAPLRSSVSSAVGLIFLVFAFCFLPSVGAQTAEFLGRQVTNATVEIEGAPGSNITEMRALIDVAPGQDYSPGRIHDALVRLFHSGLIASARVEATADGTSGVALRFIVRPRARIDAVVFAGTPIFPATELRARLNQLDPGQFASSAAVQRGLGELQAFYSSRGYLKAQITSDVQLDATGVRATVIYTINPGEQAKVSKFEIAVRGARPDFTKLPHTSVGGPPVAATAVQDVMDHLRNLYLNQDYLGARISQNITPDVNNNTVAVGVNVVSRPKITVNVEGLDISP